MSGQSVVILGGGVGGLVAASELARRLPDGHRMVLVERERLHAFAPSFLWLMTGERRPDQITRDVRSLVPARVELVHAEARSIDWKDRLVVTDGQAIPFDYLVIALGAELAPETIPGLREAGHTFYSLAGAERLQGALRRFTGGTVAVVVAAMPYKCPGAPHEGAMLLADHFRRRGLRGKVDLHLFTPESQAMPVAGPELGAAVGSMLEARGVAFHPSHRLTTVGVGTRELFFDGKPAARYDLLVAIPPHRGPRVVREAGLANETGWVPVDRRTLAAARERVYAIGDVTSRWCFPRRASSPTSRRGWWHGGSRRRSRERSSGRSSAATATACSRPARTSRDSPPATSSPNPRPRSGSGASGEHGTSGRCCSSGGGSRRRGCGAARSSSR
jgi:sulfide:quinone oxidoreductase